MDEKRPERREKAVSRDLQLSDKQMPPSEPPVMALTLRNTLASSGAAGQEQWTQRVMIFHSTHASGLPLSAGPLLGSLEEKKKQKRSGKTSLGPEELTTQ